MSFSTFAGLDQSYPRAAALPMRRRPTWIATPRAQKSFIVEKAMSGLVVETGYAEKVF
jgi:hypothetical protein